MTARILFVVASAICLIACNDMNKREQRLPLPADNRSGEQQAHQYIHVQGKDTIRLVLRPSEKEISGRLDILYFEKDSRRGEIASGQMKGDTLFAVYNSTQEGQQCECEIAFLKKGESYIMSNDIFGEANYQYNDDYTKGAFKNRKAIRFDGAILKKSTAE